MPASKRQIRPYKVYTAWLTQSGTGAPVATILENEIGNIVWVRNSAGNYQGNLTGAFDQNKTLVIPPQQDNTIDVGFPFFSAGWNDNNSVYVLTGLFNVVSQTNTPTDGLLSGPGYTFIEIRIYE